MIISSNIYSWIFFLFSARRIVSECKKNVWALMEQMTQSTVNTSKLKLIRFITDIDKQFFE